MSPADDPHERYDVPDADILFEDTWAEADDVSRCSACGRTVPERTLACPACGGRVFRCVGSCSVCVSPVCVGDERGRGK